MQVKPDRELTQQLTRALQDVQKLKVGMTRADVLRDFMIPGGVSIVTRKSRSYVFRRCLLIKVTIEFAPIGPPTDLYGESPADKITRISAPFLEWFAYD